MRSVAEIVPIFSIFLDGDITCVDPIDSDPKSALDPLIKVVASTVAVDTNPSPVISFDALSTNALDAVAPPATISV